MKQKYEDFVKKTGQDDPVDYFFSGLVEEVGEVLRLRRKEIRGKEITPKQYLDELGDVLWFVTALATKVAEADLEKVINHNMMKIIRKRNQL